MRLITLTLILLGFLACDKIVDTEDTSTTEAGSSDSTSESGAQTASDTFFGLVSDLEQAADRETASTVLKDLQQFLTADKLAEIKSALGGSLLKFKLAVSVIEAANAKFFADADHDEGADGHDSSDPIGDIIDTIRDIIGVITDVLNNSVVIGGMGCGTIAVDASKPPLLGSDFCEEVKTIAECVIDKCVDPYEPVYCDSMTVEQRNNVPVCKINPPPSLDPWTLCGVRTGVCLPAGKSVDKPGDIADIIDAVINEGLDDLGDDGEGRGGGDAGGDAGPVVN